MINFRLIAKIKTNEYIIMDVSFAVLSELYKFYVKRFITKIQLKFIA